MRSVSIRLGRNGAVLALLVALSVVPGSYADDNPFEPPEARIRPPIGMTAQPESPGFTKVIWAWLMARIGPPGGLQ